MRYHPETIKVIIDETYIKPKENNMTEIAKKFAYHIPSEDGMVKIQILRSEYTELDALITELAPSAPDTTHALRMLKDPCICAINSVVQNDPKSVAT